MTDGLRNNYTDLSMQKIVFLTNLHIHSPDEDHENKNAYLSLEMFSKNISMPKLS